MFHRLGPILFGPPLVKSWQLWHFFGDHLALADIRRLQAIGDGGDLRWGGRRRCRLRGDGRAGRGRRGGRGRERRRPGRPRRPSARRRCRRRSAAAAGKSACWRSQAMTLARSWTFEQPGEGHLGARDIRPRPSQELVQLLIGPDLVGARLHRVGEGVAGHVGGLGADDVPQVGPDLVRPALGEVMAGLGISWSCPGPRRHRPWPGGPRPARSPRGRSAGRGRARHFDALAMGLHQLLGDEAGHHRNQPAKQDRADYLVQLQRCHFSKPRREDPYRPSRFGRRNVTASPQAVQ